MWEFPTGQSLEEGIVTTMKVLYCYEDEGIGMRICAYMNTVVLHGSGES